MANDSIFYRPDFLAMFEASGKGQKRKNGNGPNWFTVQIGVARTEEHRFGYRGRDEPFTMPPSLRAYVFDRGNIGTGTLVLDVGKNDALRLLDLAREHPDEFEKIFYGGQSYSALAANSLVRYGIDISAISQPTGIVAHLAHEPFLDYLPSRGQKDFMNTQAQRIIYAHSLAEEIGATLPEGGRGYASDLVNFSQVLRAERPVPGDKKEDFLFCGAGGHIYQPTGKMIVRQFIADAQLNPEGAYGSKDCPEHAGTESLLGLEGIAITEVGPGERVLDFIHLPLARRED